MSSPDPVTKYCQDVASGKIVSGRLAIAACERHLADLKDGEKRGLYWRPELIDKPLRFFPTVLSITAGDAAMIGQPFTLLPWHVLTLGSLYGWRRADGRRRFRYVYCETGRGQVKGPFAAGLMLLETFFSGVSRCEGYAIGETMVTSQALFRDACAMVRATIPGGDPGDSLEHRGLLKIRGGGEDSWQIEHPKSGSIFRALAIGESISGPRPRYVVADELHEWKRIAPLIQWRSAITKAPDDAFLMMLTNTPASSQTVGTEISNQFQSIARRETKSDASFAFIARTDPGDDPLNNEACWPKSLPALGISYPVDNVREEVQAAKGSGAIRNAVLRLYFGVPAGDIGFWIDQDAWEAALAEVDEAKLAAYPCFLGLDLSRKNDLTALAIVWLLPNGDMTAKVRYWKPTSSFAKDEAEDGAHYGAWAADGHLNGTDGKTVDYTFVAAEIRRLTDSYNVQAMAFDPSFFDDFQEAAEEVGLESYEHNPSQPAGHGLKMIRHAQGARGLHSERSLFMPRSFRSMCDAILSGSLKVQQNPVTTYCASNVTLGSDGLGNLWIDKKKTRSHVDGMVALCMAIGAATNTTPEAPKKQSIWDREDFLAVLA